MPAIGQFSPGFGMHLMYGFAGVSPFWPTLPSISPKQGDGIGTRLLGDRASLIVRNWSNIERFKTLITG